MRNSLKEEIKKLNYDIENRVIVNPNKLTILPLIQNQNIKEKFSEEKLSEILDLSSEDIKKLKFYEMNNFLNDSTKIEEYLSEFTDVIIDNLPQDSDIQSINFLLYELLINIYKHSQFKNAYIQINTTENNQIIELCIIDDGIGIPGSFKEDSIKFEDDCNAIFEALNGKTTDKEKYKLHGRGLNSSARITTLGFEGEMLIASGKGICLINSDGIETCKNRYEIAGTFIILKIPNKKIENIYNYLKYEKINKIQGVEE
ncbi:ATP-binding protein [uncultured Methanobrevibacter sp.]|uniref:ATP-binding protein n=1 Tax=uncultured Methanobrevibacter sp. TaxID=253161 RepID=UPI0026218DF1|nr:ATP-binding protein [uncultured Methanobrevibacter sp.]